MICNAFKEIFGKNIYFVDRPMFLWDKIKKIVHDDSPSPMPSIGLTNYGLTNYPTVEPSTDIIDASANYYYFIDDEHTVETFLDDFKDCPVVIYLNYDGSIYQGEDKFICPTCGMQHPPRTSKHIRYFIDNQGLRKLKLKKLKT